MWKKHPMTGPHRAAVAAIALMGLALAGCEIVPGISAMGFQPGMTLIATGLCDTRAAVLDMAKAGQTSAAAAETTARAHLKSGACSHWRQPSATVMVVAVIHEYRDYRGRPTQVLKVSTPFFPDREFFTLTLTARARSRQTRD